MGLKTEIMDKILEPFYEYPSEKFTVRSLEKKTKIPRSTVQKYLAQLKKEKLIKENNEASKNTFFKTKKTFYFIERMIKSGLLDYLEKELKPNCIVLFGGVRKGESDKDSDIDLFIETYHSKELNLTKYQKKLKHNVQLFLEENINKLPENLQLNIINGIKLTGFLRIKK